MQKLGEDIRILCDMFMQADADGEPSDMHIFST